MQGILDTVGQQAGSHASDNARAAGDAAYMLFTQSKLALNGLLLTFAGFLGIFGVVTLQLQAAIISVYVTLFGVALMCFAAGWNTQLLQEYFGFMYRPGGQLAFLLMAGNLAWSTGFVGILAAVYTNATALATYRSDGAPPLPEWFEELTRRLGIRSSSRVDLRTVGSATGMVDVQRGELL